MYEDDVIAGVRKTKERIAAEFGYDVHALARALREKQRKDGRRVVNLRHKRPMTVHSDQAHEE